MPNIASAGPAASIACWRTSIRTLIIVSSKLRGMPDRQGSDRWRIVFSSVGYRKCGMPTPVWSHYPLVATEPQGRSWLTLLGNLGRSPATVDAYGRGLDQFLRYCQAYGIDA